MTQTLTTTPPGRYRIRQVVRAETIKMLTLRSTAVMLGITVVATLAVTVLTSHAALHHTAQYYLGFDPTQQAIGAMVIAGLTGGVFGALLITGEYSSGTIRTTLAAAPRRPLLLAGKVVVTAVAATVFCVLLTLASFLLGEAVLAGGGAPHADLGSPGALRAVVLTGLFVALLALLSFGLGLLFRSTAAAIAAFVGIVFVLPLIMHGISDAGLRYVPTNLLTNSVMSTVNQGPGELVRPFPPAVALLLMALYAAVVVAAGAVRFVRRDA
jgi:ABC-type transport system involved in multi-copper enzyme maturation permease subunit